MPQITFSASQDPGAEASDEAKMEYYRINSSTSLMKLCILNGIQTPLDVVMRTDTGGGTQELYFGDEAHMRLYFHKICGTGMDADLDTLLETACEMSGEDDVGVLMKHGKPFRIVWEFPTYAGLVRDCYNAGLQMEQDITQEAQQEAATIQAQSATRASLAPATFVDSGLQHHNAMQSVNDSQMLAANQMMGFAPTKVVGGIPHYNESRADIAATFRN